MMYFLGLLTGILITGLVLVFSILLKPETNRVINRLGSKFKPKGVIIEAEREEVSDWVKSIQHE